MLVTGLSAQNQAGKEGNEKPVHAVSRQIPAAILSYCLHGNGIRIVPDGWRNQHGASPHHPETGRSANLL